MRTSTIRSVVALTISIIAITALWLIVATTTNPHSIALAAPDSGVVGMGTPASCTQAALEAKLTGGGSLTFNCGANPVTIVVTNTLSIAADTTVDGGGKITLSGGDASKVFFVNSGIRLTLNNITIEHGNSAFGGCITVYGTLNVTQATFQNCHSYTSWIFAGSGGAILSFNGTVALTNTVVRNNSVELNGGGIYLLGGQAALNHVDVLSNTAWLTDTGSGGGVAIGANTNFVASDSNFSYNKIGYQGQGGGLYVYSSTTLLVNVSANYNRALNAADGGGFYAENSQFTLQGGSAIGNYGLYDGGGLTLDNTVANISNATINNNTVSSNGGGISAYKGSLTLNNVTVNNNTGGSDGGGFSLYQTPTSLTQITVTNNHSGRSGGGINCYWETLTLDHVTVSGNVAETSQGDGGGIYIDRGTLVASNSIIDHNTTTGHGGGVFNTSTSNLDFTNVTLSANTAAIDGGGIYNEPTIINGDVSVINLTNVTFKDNRASNDGGGFFNAANVGNTVNLKNTVIADSTPQNCVGKAFTTAKYSLSTDQTCTLSGVGNKTQTPANLFPLLNNGGSTRTHLPGPSSVLVNGVSGVDCPIVDQRGVSRPQGSGCDIGAVERKSTDVLIAPWLYLPLIKR